MSQPAAPAPRESLLLDGWGPTAGDLRRFWDPRLAGRRLLAEALGTFILVLVAAGAGMMNERYPGSVPLPSHAGAVALVVFMLIATFGRISGCHLNAAVTVGFALRHVFPWHRVPGYLGAQLVGAIGAAIVLRFAFADVPNAGTLTPGAGVDDVGLLLWEAVLTFGLLTVILAVVNGGMNVGSLAAFAIAAWFGSAILWAGPIGASMNPTRQLGPALPESKQPGNSPLDGHGQQQGEQVPA